MNDDSGVINPMKKGSRMISLKKLVNSVFTSTPMTIVVNDEKTASNYPMEKVIELMFGGTISFGIKPGQCNFSEGFPHMTIFSRT